MGVGTLNSNGPVYQESGDVVGNTLEAESGHLYFRFRSQRHPIRVMTTTRTVRVGCTTITREAWELLKRKVDGSPA